MKNLLSRIRTAMKLSSDKVEVPADAPAEKPENSILLGTCPVNAKGFFAELSIMRAESKAANSAVTDLEEQLTAAQKAAREALLQHKSAEALLTTAMVQEFSTVLAEKKGSMKGIPKFGVTTDWNVFAEFRDPMEELSSMLKDALGGKAKVRVRRRKNGAEDTPFDFDENGLPDEILQEIAASKGFHEEVSAEDVPDEVKEQITQDGTDISQFRFFKNGAGKTMIMDTKPGIGSSASDDMFGFGNLFGKELNLGQSSSLGDIFEKMFTENAERSDEYLEKCGCPGCQAELERRTEKTATAH